MTATRSVPLLPLICPACGGDLSALEEDTAFACLECHRGLELGAERLEDRPLRLMPRPGSRSGFHLPFWSFPGRVRVPAFNTRELLPLSRQLSGVDLQEEGGTATALVGASLASREAWRVARFAGLVPGERAARPATLLGVPFLDEGNRLRELATGVPLYKETIHRVEMLIRAARGGAGPSGHGPGPSPRLA